MSKKCRGSKRGCVSYIVCQWLNEDRGGVGGSKKFDVICICHLRRRDGESATKMRYKFACNLRRDDPERNSNSTG